jgi:hypothetical protein
MMRKKKPKTGEVLTMNQHWKVSLVAEGIVELENMETRDKFRMPLAHLYSLQAIIEEVKRLYG